MIRNRFSRDLSSFLRKNTSFHFLAISVILLGLNACYNEPNTIGWDMIPSEDKSEILVTDTFKVAAYTIKTDTLITSNFSIGLLGCYNDSIFGKTKSEFFSRIVPASKTDTLKNITTRPEPDSLILTLKLLKTWGEKNKAINIKVFQLTDSINGNKYYNGLAPVSLAYNPVEVDSLTEYSGEGYLKIRFKKNFARMIINSPDTVLTDYYKFMKYFKGLYFTSDDYNDTKGVLYSFDISSGFTFTLYYMKPTPNGPRKATFSLIPTIYRFAHFQHNYDNVEPALKVNMTTVDKINETPEDTVFCVEGLGGVRGLIKFKSLSAWREKMPIAINRAELRFDVQTHSKHSVDSTIKKLYFYNYRSYDTRTNYVTDIPIYDSRVSASSITTYNRAKQYYSIDVTVQLQNLINSKLNRDYIYIEPTSYQNTYMNGLYKTGNNSKPMKLIITYSKL